MGDPGDAPSAFESCMMTLNMMTSDWEKIKDGAPLWVIFKYVFLAPTVLLLLAGYHRGLIDLGRRIGGSYVRWFKGEDHRSK